jgi:hypothetical protein
MHVSISAHYDVLFDPVIINEKHVDIENTWRGLRIWGFAECFPQTLFDNLMAKEKL